MEHKLSLYGQDSLMARFEKTDDLLKDLCGIIESARNTAYQAVNTALVQRNWLLGYRIAEEELGGEERAEYGTEVIKKLLFILQSLSEHFPDTVWKICRPAFLVTLRRSFTGRRQRSP